MDFLIMIGKAVLVLLAVAGVALPLVCEKHNYQFVWSIWRRFRVKMFFECLGVVAVMVAAVIVLRQIPGLSYGWIKFFYSGDGNVLVTPIMEGSKSNSIWVRSLIPIYFAIFVFVIPFLARAEENIFRKGHTEWGAIIKQSVKFGLVHCLVGVPLANGVALIISGLFFGFKYKRTFDQSFVLRGHSGAEDEALMVSATYHTMYNMIVAGPLFLIALAAV